MHWLFNYVAFLLAYTVVDQLFFFIKDYFGLFIFELKPFLPALIAVSVTSILLYRLYLYIVRTPVIYEIAIKSVPQFLQGASGRKYINELYVILLTYAFSLYFDLLYRFYHFQYGYMD